MSLDDLDKQILSFLQEDGRANYVTLAAELGVSEGTIRKRVRRLEENGVFRTVGITDPFRVGLNTVAFLWFDVKRGMIESVIRELRNIPIIHYLVVTTGSHDLVAMVVLPNSERLIQLLNNELPSVEGIVSTETSIVLRIHKQIHNWSPFKES